VLEPRSNTMKLGAMKSRLAESLREADLVFCHAGGIDWDVGEALAPLGARVHIGQDPAALATEIAARARPGDSVLIMSNGGFGGIHARLLAELARSDAA
jgi:UDP-N-acetylmuramate: L-alanyl-gamma-D-glutamyl-meso-diaminopimelate ligase